FGCACCRRIWHLLSDQRSRDAVEVVERYADGLASRREIDEAYGPARIAVEDTPLFPEPDRPWINNNVAGYHAARAVVWLLSENIASWQATTEATKAVRGARRDGEEDAVSPERHKQAALLRCIVGNPFRAVSRDPAWLSWQNGTIPKIALGIYERSNSRTCLSWLMLLKRQVVIMPPFSPTAEVQNHTLWAAGYWIWCW